MKDSNATVSKIEEYILFSKKAFDANQKVTNLPQLERNPNYKNDVTQIEFWRYVNSGDHHYFVSRLLFLHYVVEYSFFSAQQCIENYLKGYLKSLNITPPNTHDLNVLLEKCKTETSDVSSFIHGTHIDVITQKFNPFNEVARYPVQKIRPKAPYGFFYPMDIYMLDYFVYRMREILPTPNTPRNIFKEGLMELDLCMREAPNFYERFKENNINFK